MGYTDIAVEIICSRPNVWEASQRVAKLHSATALCGGMDPSDPQYTATKTQWEVDQQISLQVRLENDRRIAATYGTNIIGGHK